MIEERLKEVQGIVDVLRSGDLSIDKAAKTIEKAMKLIEEIELDLKKEEKKIEFFSQKSEKNLE